MSITLNEVLANANYQRIYELLLSIISEPITISKSNKGRPLKYNDIQIILCMLYGVKNSIFSLRELEYKINRDFSFRVSIGICKSPDYSTFSIRINKLEDVFYGYLYKAFIKIISPDTRLCAVDSTALRSTKYDSEATIGKGIRLGFFTGYKLHVLSSVTDYIIPLAFEIMPANKYDNQAKILLDKSTEYDIFLVIGDGAEA
ncbi:hypothetical protein AN642_00595 [Epulopiscium sp. SCG-B10WGA-EpuloA2]|nr:hypothetical protein AN642_00595 [Epulopiscium sp. SCG-B10WGA-EpuloA2]